MKHPVLDRILILLCALLAFAGAAGIVLLLLGYFSVDQISILLGRVNPESLTQRISMILCTLVLVILGVLLIGITLPGKRKRSSNYAIQHNENGMVRISVKALETLVQKVLDEHAELKVVTSSTHSDEESVRVDLHVTMQSDISMPLAISALQKQIKKYIESCSGVMVQEVRVYVDNTTPSTSETGSSPYAIPASLLGKEQEQLPHIGQVQSEAERLPAPDEQAVQTEPEKTQNPDEIQTEMDGSVSEDGVLEDAPLFSDVTADADPNENGQV